MEEHHKQHGSAHQRTAVLTEITPLNLLHFFFSTNLVNLFVSLRI
jgi:hypothetical protein